MSNKNNVEIKVDTMSEEDKKSLEFLKSQKDNVVVIDVQDQNREGEFSETEKKRKHVNIFKQFLIPKVYYTAICAYLLSRLATAIYAVIIGILTYTNVIGGGKTETNSNQQSLEDTMKETNCNIYYILYITILGPIIEELIFRLCIFRGIWIVGDRMERNKTRGAKLVKFLAYIISSFLFAFGHFGFFNIKVLMAEFISFPIYFIMGLALAMAYAHDGYFLAAVFTHMLNNAVATALMIFVTKSGFSEDFTENIVIPFISLLFK